MEVAKEKGLRYLKHHLLPRKKGFVFLAKHLEGTYVHVHVVLLSLSLVFFK